MSNSKTQNICNLCNKEREQLKNKCEICGCKELICDDCFHKRQVCRRHREHMKTKRILNSETLEIFKNLQREETEFLGRVKTQFTDLNKGVVLYHPLTEDSISLKLNLIKESKDENFIPSNLTEQIDMIPLNRYVVYSLKLPKSILTGEMTSALIEAKFWFNWSNISDTVGFIELHKTTRHELVQLLERKSRAGERKGAYTIFGVFSPTGWNDDAIQGIERKQITFPNLSPILISDSSLHFNKGDLISAFFAPLFSKEHLVDRYKNCKDEIKNEFIGRLDMSLERLRSAFAERSLEYPSSVILAAMREIGNNEEDFYFKEEESSSGKTVKNVLIRKQQ